MQYCRLVPLPISTSVYKPALRVNPWTEKQESEAITCLLSDFIGLSAGLDVSLEGTWGRMNDRQ